MIYFDGQPDVCYHGSGFCISLQLEKTDWGSLGNCGDPGSSHVIELASEELAVNKHGEKDSLTQHVVLPSSTCAPHASF